MGRFRFLALAVVCACCIVAPGADGAASAPPVTGKAQPGLEAFDRAVQAMMQRYAIPGAALALVHDGRLVYARGFGYANVATKTPVRPDARFRIASISKAITQTAIAKLVEEGKLHVSDRAFRILALKPPPHAHVDPRVYTITISDLLQHRSGWPDTTNDAADVVPRALGTHPPATCAQLARHMLGQPLAHAPGTHREYSNFGYCLLGLVIEKITGQTYEHFVQRQILAPTGAHHTAMGDVRHTLPGEVRYYPTTPKVPSDYPEVHGPVPVPYAFDLPAYYSAGALVSTTVDLLRYLTNLNGTRGTRILSDETKPTKDFDIVFPVGPGWGLSVEGELPGTRTILALDDTTAWALLLNIEPTEPSFNDKDVLWSAIDSVTKSVTTWPDLDLWSSYP